MPDKPRMDDYLGCVVKLKHDLHTVGQVRLAKGNTYVVSSHWRGRLTLSHRRDKTVNGYTTVAIRQVSRNDVEVICQPLD